MELVILATLNLILFCLVCILIVCSHKRLSELCSEVIRLLKLSSPHSEETLIIRQRVKDLIETHKMLKELRQALLEEYEEKKKG